MKAAAETQRTTQKRIRAAHSALLCMCLGGFAFMATSAAAQTTGTASDAADPAVSSGATAYSAAAENDASAAEARRATDIALDYWLFTRGEVRRGYALLVDRNAQDFVRYRTQLGVRITHHFDHNWHVGARVLVRAGGYWNVGGNSLEDADLSLHEGYTFIGNDRMNFQIGRFEMLYGDQLVIGPVGFHHVGRTFDGGRASFKLTEDGKAFVDVFGTTLGEGSLDGSTRDELEPLGADDFYFLGVYAGLEGLTPIPGAWDLYALPRIGAGVGTDVTFGTRLNGCADVFCWRGETGFQAGKRPTTGDTVSGAWHIDAEVGVTTDTVLQRAMVGALYASGNNPNTAADNGWNQLYPTAHKWMGHMDLFSRRNVSAAQASVAFQFTETFGANLKAFNFFINEGPGAGNFGPESGYAGTELNASIQYDIFPILDLFVEYGLFAPDEGDALHMLLVQLTLKDKVDVW